MKYAAPYHDTLFKSWNSSVIFGMAVPRIVWKLTCSVSVVPAKFDIAILGVTNVVKRYEEDAKQQ